MERRHHLRLTEDLRRGIEVSPEPFTVPAGRYRDEDWCARERDVLFGDPRSGWPRPVAASTDLAAGARMPFDAPGIAALLTRDRDGVVHAFANACRHRGTRLVDAPGEAKAMVCPYHGWTYDLGGALIHVPHEGAFGRPCVATRGLVPLPVLERHGLLWLGPDTEERLAPLGADLDALGLDRHVRWRRSRTTRRCNWKLVIEAFLDGYHIRVLHRDSIYRFFLDAASVAEPVGPHIRAVTGRRALRDAPADLDGLDLRQLGTPSFVIFPSTVLVEHPDFISIITVQPLAPDVTDWDHLMLVPADRADDAEHWDRSWAMIEQTVFQGEDLWVCEQVQRGIAAGTTEELLFGSLESPVRWFHDAVERALAG